MISFIRYSDDSLFKTTIFNKCVVTNRNLRLKHRNHNLSRMPAKIQSLNLSSWIYFILYFSAYRNRHNSSCKSSPVYRLLHMNETIAASTFKRALEQSILTENLNPVSLFVSRTASEECRRYLRPSYLSMYVSKVLT